VKLTGLITAVAQPFLGILPLRDDPDVGVEVRYVFPKSPAEAAGLKAGDRVLKVGQGKNPLQAFSGRDQLAALLGSVTPGTQLTLEVQRKGQKEPAKLTVKLGEMTDFVPAALPEPATLKKALAPRKEVGPRPGVPMGVPVPVPAKKE